MQSSRRIKAAFISRLDSVRFLIGRSKFKGFPEDARIVGFFHDYARDGLGIYVESDTFPEVKVGECVDYLDLYCEHPDPTKVSKCEHCGREKDPGPCWWCGQ